MTSWKTNDHLPTSQYLASERRYEELDYQRCGQRGLKLPKISLGLWHNFGDQDDLHNSREILRKAFDLGITHFDLANNYGPAYGSAEENFGRLFKKDFLPYRDELIISSKAGYDMWPGPYGRGGSKKYIISSCEQTLKRMGLDYVDIFYHHCPDPETPIHETMEALAQLVHQGKALYVGISNYYHPEGLLECTRQLQEHKVPLLINQLRYSMLDQRAEKAFNEMDDLGVGCIAFSPFEQGILAGKYVDGVPEDSRVKKEGSYLSEGQGFSKKVELSRQLHSLAQKHDLTLKGLALAWVLRRKTVCSALIGASSPDQLTDNVQGLSQSPLDESLLASVQDLLSHQP